MAGTTLVSSILPTILQNVVTNSTPAEVHGLKRKESRMATYFGPVPLLSPTGTLSVSTSPSSTTSSGDSPQSGTTLKFTVSYMHESSISPRGTDVTPKIEELDEDFAIDTKIESPPETSRNREEGDVDTTQTPNGTVVRRPRGRPRKHPKSPPSNSLKAPKGRSKTGCMTCRRRKKKCDETRPECEFARLRGTRGDYTDQRLGLHCQKNNVKCEGYPPKDYWQSGKQRTTKGQKDGCV